MEPGVGIRCGRYACRPSTLFYVQNGSVNTKQVRCIVSIILSGTLAEDYTCEA
jgi:hypothetical protein